MLRRELIAAVLIALLADPAFADLQGAPAGAPTFTSEETMTIQRNKTLLEISKTNPWIVRKLLDAVEQSKNDKKLPAPSNGDGEDPDLDQMQRASPEAAHDLFQLLKQAGEKKPDAPK
jgi:hypothetical protein